MIIKDYKEMYKIQFDGVVCLAKIGDNKGIDGEVFKVVTGICFKNLKGKEIYKQERINSYICRFKSDTSFFNLEDIIEELALYVDKCDIETYFKNKIIDEVLENNNSALTTIRLFKKQYFQKKQEEIRKEIIEKNKEEVEKIKGDIEKVVKEISCYVECRIAKPNKNNDYHLEFMTRKTLKKFNVLTMYNNEEEVKKYNQVLQWLEEYLYYLSIKKNPNDYLEFDKIIK